MAQSNQSYPNTSGTRASEAQDAVHQLKRKAEDAYDTATTEGARVLRNAGEQAETAIDATKRFVRSQPLLAIGAVAAFACAVGVLWKLAPGRRNTDLMDRLADYVEPGYRAIRRRI